MSYKKQTARPLIEPLEDRCLLSTVTLRIAEYNIEADIDGVTTPRAGLATVLEGIGEENLSGTTRPLDVLALEETTSNAQTVAPIVASLNSYYGAGTYAMSTYQGTESEAFPAEGNGPNALIYNTKTVKLLASVGVGVPNGASDGEYRQVIRYELEPVGGNSGASHFYVYVEHSKSGSSTTDAKYRGEEAAIVRADEATLPPGSRVIYVGDFNSSTVAETYYQDLAAAGNGQAFDPENPTNTNTGVNPAPNLLTESATNLEYRDDYQFQTADVINDVAGGLEYVTGTYHAFGNNGSVPDGGNVDAGTDTALVALPNGAAVLAALTTASDHLPVVADYTDTTAPVAYKAKSLVAWDMAGQVGSGKQSLPPTQVDPSAVVTTDLLMGAGVVPDSYAPANAWGGDNWAFSAADGETSEQTITFGLTPSSGNTLALSDITLNYRTTAGGPTSALWQYQLNNGSWVTIKNYPTAFKSTSKSGSVMSVDLAGVAALQQISVGTTVNLRVIPYGATSSSAGFFIYNEKGSDLEVDGIVM